MGERVSECMVMWVSGLMGERVFAKTTIKKKLKTIIHKTQVLIIEMGKQTKTWKASVKKDMWLGRLNCVKNQSFYSSVHGVYWCIEH